MRSYNICILREHEGGVYGEQGDFCRALTRIGDHNVFPINFRKIYDLNGPKIALEIINEEIRKCNAEIVLTGLGNSYEFPIEFFYELRRHCFVIMFTGDDEHYYDKSTRYYSQGFDLVWAASRQGAVQYESFGMDTMVSGALFDFRDIDKNSYEKIYDVCFVGEVYRKVGREEYLKHLQENGISVVIFGEGTPGGRVSRKELYRLYGSSKIGLSFSGVSVESCLDRDITINRRRRQVKGRPREIALTGTFVLAEYAPGIGDEFEIEKEIDIFHSKEELLSKVKFYLNSDAVREKIALNGHNRALQDYEEVRGWKRLMEIIGAKIEVKNNNPGHFSTPIYKDPIFKKAYSSFHLFKFLEFALKGMPKAAFHELMVYAKYPLFDGGVFLWYVENYVLRLLVKIKWLRGIVQKVKNIMKNYDD